MKHLNDILNEGILNVDDNEKNMNETIRSQAAIKWVKEHISKNAQAYADQIEKNIEVNKDGSISIDFLVDLSLEEDMPDYVQFDYVYDLTYKIMNKSIPSIKLNFPKSTGSVKVVAHESRGKSLSINIESAKGSHIDNVEFRGDIGSIKFPKDFGCEHANLMNLENLKLETTKFPKCKQLDLPRTAVENYLRKQWKIDAEKIKMWN